MSSLASTNTEISNYRERENIGLSNEHQELLDDLQELKVANCSNGNSSISVDQNAIKSAIAIAQLWPTEIPLPTLDLDEDGSVALYSFDSHGYVIAGLEALNKTNNIAYIIYNNERKIACTGYLDSESKAEIEEFFKKLEIERSN